VAVNERPTLLAGGKAETADHPPVGLEGPVEMVAVGGLL
jgi:hypothetical protein